VTAQVDNNTTITLSSHDNVLLGQTAAELRSYRPPEPYQGKGVMYEGEKIKRKAGKTGKK
jgi:large subunit ribosomal protein L6